MKSSWYEANSISLMRSQWSNVNNNNNFIFYFWNLALHVVLLWYIIIKLIHLIEWNKNCDTYIKSAECLHTLPIHTHGQIHSCVYSFFLYLNFSITLGCYVDVSLCGNFIKTQCSSLFSISSCVRWFLQTVCCCRNNLLLHLLRATCYIHIVQNEKWIKVKCSINQCVCCSAVVLFAICTCHRCMSMDFVFYAQSMWYDFVLMMHVCNIFMFL